MVGEGAVGLISSRGNGPVVVFNLSSFMLVERGDGASATSRI